MPNPRFDFVVVGGGIVGLATAMELSRTHSVAVLEKEDALARHQTGNNSGVIHSGLYYKPGSLKAKTCTEGRLLLERFCEERCVPFDRCGKIVVATRESELAQLEELERRARANGLSGARRIDADAIKEYEPNAAGIAALHVPETGIVDYTRVAEEYAKVIGERGGAIVRGARVLSVLRRDGAIVIETTRGVFVAGALVGCAGLQSDRLARICGVDPGVRIVPFRGEYYELVPERAQLVKNLIYPVPNPAFPFLGVHFTRMMSGGVEAGPNAVLSLAREGYTRTSFDPVDAFEVATFPGFWRLAKKYWRTGVGEVWRSFSKRAFVEALNVLLPALSEDDLREAGAGVRAQAMLPSGALVDDFHIVAADRMVHVLNAPSPAATASIAIGRAVAERARSL